MFKKYLFLIIYRLFAQHLPPSSKCKFAKWTRYQCCKRIFKNIGKNVNIEKKAYFGKGFELSIGTNSGIGINCRVPHDITIGENVLMGPNVFIFGGTTHVFKNPDIPIKYQGYEKCRKVIIEDDIWIGRDSVINQGRTIKKGTIIAARSVVTKDFPEYSIIGGNPARIIRLRK